MKSGNWLVIDLTAQRWDGNPPRELTKAQVDALDAATAVRVKVKELEVFEWCMAALPRLLALYKVVDRAKAELLDGVDDLYSPCVGVYSPTGRGKWELVGTAQVLPMDEDGERRTWNASDVAQ